METTRRPAVLCTAWIAVCFSLTSAAWISNEYHLMDMMDGALVDLYSMVIGYLLQAVGAALSVRLFRRRTEHGAGLFPGIAAAFFLITAIALFSRRRMAVLLLQMVMNLGCGMIAGYYLFGATVSISEDRYGKAFGIGYAASTIFVYLLSLAGENSFLRNRWALAVYLVLKSDRSHVVL